MSFNLPILSSDAASLPEVGGNKIIYFNPLNQKDLIGKMTDLLKGDLRCDIFNYKDQLKKFNWKIENHRY